MNILCRFFFVSMTLLCWDLFAKTNSDQPLENRQSHMELQTLNNIQVNTEEVGEVLGFPKAVNSNRAWSCCQFLFFHWQVFCTLFGVATLLGVIVFFLIHAFSFYGFIEITEVKENI